MFFCSRLFLLFLLVVPLTVVRTDAACVQQTEKNPFSYIDVIRDNTLLSEGAKFLLENYLLQYSFDEKIANQTNGSPYSTTLRTVSDAVPNDYNSNAAADILREIRSEIDGAGVTNIYTVDLDGYVVASVTDALTNYYVGDDAFFLDAMNNCDGGLYVSSSQYEEVALPVIDYLQSRVVGVIVWQLSSNALPCHPSFRDLNDDLSYLENEEILSDRARYFVSLALPWTHDATLVNVCTDADRSQESAEDIQTKNSEWMTAVDDTVVSDYQSSILTNAASLRLHELINSTLQDPYDPANLAYCRAHVKNMFLLDTQHGSVIGSTFVTNQYYYREDSVWTNAYHDCAGAIHAEIIEDDNDEQEISLPIYTEYNTLVGILVMIFAEEGSPCQKPATGSILLREEAAGYTGVSDGFQQRTLSLLLDEITKHTYDEVLTRMCLESEFNSDTMEEFYQRDVDWIAASDSGQVSDFQMSIKNNNASAHLSAIIDDIASNAIGASQAYEIREVFLMDSRGGTIGLTEITSDYNQGDEAKFQDSYAECTGAIHIGDLEIDESTGFVLQQISGPIINQNNRVVGAITWGVQFLPPETVHHYVDDDSAAAAIIITFVSLGILALVLAIIALFFFQNNPKIKSLSVPMTSSMCMGAILALISPLFEIGEPTDTSCNIRVWCLVTGVSLFLVCLITKIDRIAKIFNPSKLASAQQNARTATKIMIASVMVLMATQMCALLLFTIVVPMKVRIEDNYDMHESTIGCYSAGSDTRNLFFVCMFGMLIAYGVKTVYESQRVHVAKNFNETKFLGFSLYFIVFVSVIALLLEFFATDHEFVAIVHVVSIFAITVSSIMFTLIPRLTASEELRFYKTYNAHNQSATPSNGTSNGSKDTGSKSSLNNSRKSSSKPGTSVNVKNNGIRISVLNESRIGDKNYVSSKLLMSPPFRHSRGPSPVPVSPSLLTGQPLGPATSSSSIAREISTRQSSRLTPEATTSFVDTSPIISPSYHQVDNSNVEHDTTTLNVPSSEEDYDRRTPAVDADPNLSDDRVDQKVQL